MRCLPLAILVVLTCASTAHAVGLTSAVVTVDVDAPLLAPVHAETPLAPEAEPVREFLENGRAPDPPTLPEEIPVLIDGEVDPLTVQVDIAPGHVMAAEPLAGKLARMERADAPIGTRASISQPTLLTPPVHATRPLTTFEGAAFTQKETPPAASPASRPVALRAPASGPEDTQVSPPAWHSVVAMGAALLFILAPLLLYHRVRGRDLARSQTRERALSAIGAQPGISASGLARALSIDPSSANYQLRRLAKDQLIVASGPPRRQRYFVAGTHAPQEREVLLAQQKGRSVLAVLREAPGLNKSSLARRLAISRAAAQWHLVALEKAGLVRMERQTRHVRVFPTTF